MALSSYADALGAITTAMMEVHEQTCEIAAPHRWERCTSTPGVYAAADALDVATDPDRLPSGVALAMHNRECDDVTCGRLPEGRVRHARYSWGDQAAAVERLVARWAGEPLPAASRVRGELLVACECGHVRRNHSLDGKGCYATPCTCQVDGGFRPDPAWLPTR
jgi:hypothetical protein